MADTVERTRVSPMIVTSLIISDTEVTEGIKISFGPHYFIKVIERDNKVIAQLGATHHAIELDASTINGELEKAINLLRKHFHDGVSD